MSVRRPGTPGAEIAPLTTRAGGQARRLRVLAAIVLRTSGGAAARRALPTYLGLFVVTVILFAGNGVRSRDVVALALQSPPVCIALLAAWLLLALPGARAVVDTPATFLLRTWPIPRRQIVGLVIALLFVVELPFILLWTKGGGVALGAAAAVIAVGGHGLLLGRPRTAAEWGAAGLWLVAIAVLAWPAAALAAGAPALCLGVRRAFIVAPERIGVTRTRALVRATRSAALAIAQTHLAIMLRAQRPALMRALWFAAGGALATGLAIANNRIGDPTRGRAIWRTVAALTAGWGVAGLAGGVQRAETQAQWFFDVCAVSASARRVGAWLALVATGALLGAATGAALGAYCPAGSLSMTADSAAAGAMGGAAAAACARWACRDDGHDGARLLGAILAAAVVLAPLAFFLAAPCLLPIAVGSLLLPGRHARQRAAAGPALLAGEG